MALQTAFHNIADNCCLAVSYLYAAYDSIADEAEKNPTFIEVAIAAALVGGLINDRDVLDKDGFVKDAERLMFLATDHKFRVTKKRIEKIQDLPLDKYACVNFEYNKHNHWVLFKGQSFLYNSLEDSQCFKYGKPVDARIIEKVL